MAVYNKYASSDTQCLVGLCIQGDPLAWAEFIRRYSPAVERAFVKRLAKHRRELSGHELEDLKQSFFVSLWQSKKLETVRETLSMNYWVVMVAANHATSFLRRSGSDALCHSRSMFEEIVGEDNKKRLRTRSDRSPLISARRSIQRL